MKSVVVFDGTSHYAMSFWDYHETDEDVEKIGGNYPDEEMAARAADELNNKNCKG